MRYADRGDGSAATEEQGAMNPMTARVRLRDVIEAIDLPNQNWQSYLDPDTGEIVTLTDEGRELVRGLSCVTTRRASSGRNCRVWKLLSWTDS